MKGLFQRIMKGLFLGVSILLLLCSCDPSHPGCCDRHNKKYNSPFDIYSTYTVSEQTSLEYGIILSEQTCLEQTCLEQTCLEQEVINKIYDCPTLMDIEINISEVVD